MEHTRSRNGPSETRRRRGARRSRSRRRSRLRRSGRTGSGGGRGGSRIEAVSSNRGAAACTGHEHGKTMSVSERTPGPYRVLAVGSVGPAERTWCARKTSRQRGGPESNKWDIYRSVACIEAEAGEEPRLLRETCEPSLNRQGRTERTRRCRGGEWGASPSLPRPRQSRARFDSEVREGSSQGDLRCVIRVLRASSRCGLPSRIELFMPQPSGGKHGAS